MEEQSSLNPQVKIVRRGGRSNLSLQDEDIRNLWSTATLSQTKLDMPLANVCELSDVVDTCSLGSRTEGSERAEQDSDAGWEESDEGADKGSLKPELNESALHKLELYSGSSLGSTQLQGDAFKSETEKSSSASSISFSRHTPHRAYWMEQQNRLPLPLLELMESEALEILTKALRTYRSDIGKDHVLTQQLQQYIERLKRHRNRRTRVLTR